MADIPTMTLILGNVPQPSLRLGIDAPPAAWLGSACGSGPGSPPCSFFSFLHVLDVVAVILGIILLAVLAVTINVFRRKRKTAREERTARAGRRSR